MTGPGLHALDGLINLAGPAVTMAGQLVHPLGEAVPTDAVSLLLRFSNGATGILGCVRGVPDHFRLAVFGRNGWAEVRQFGELTTHLADRPVWTENYPRALAVAKLLERFADAVAGQAAFPVSTLSMLQTVAAFEAAVASFTASGPVHVVPVSASA